MLNIQNRASIYTLLASQLDKMNSYLHNPCLGIHSEATLNKFIHLSYFDIHSYTYQLHKQNRKEKETQEPQHQIYVVHPQCRGYVHRTVLYIQLVTTETVLICALSYRSFPFLSRALSCRLFPSYKPSAHSAAEVVHALSWDLTLNLKIDLTIFASHHHSLSTFN
jgi:hypothetical protein